MLVRDGVLITPPISSNILEGITRRTMLSLAQDALGVPVVEREIDRSELYLADEALFCGTGVQIAPITRIDHRRVGEGTIGPVTQRLSDLYFRIVRGGEPTYAHWLSPVPQAQGATA
jgi:branched-chain amino acid aminotransferase